ncbi:hypothetical protein ACHAXM_000107, partial [Skeletonema potamos]
RDLQSSNVASTSPSSASPLAAVVQAPIFSPAAVTTSIPPMNTFDESAASTCFDTPNWKDEYVRGCDWYEKLDDSGCPKLGRLYEGNMGVANDNCCHCGGGSHSLPPTASPTITSSPTKSATPSSSSAPSMCNDTPGWYNYLGYDCVWYEVLDDPGCPKYGNLSADELDIATMSEGSAKDNCCYCQNDVDSNVSPTTPPSSSGTCVDTEGWEAEFGCGCEHFQEIDYPGCPELGKDGDWPMGPASENCCYCKDPTCDHYKSACQYFTTLSLQFWAYYPDLLQSTCDTAASCDCEAAVPVKIVTNLYYNSSETVGLYNECRCDFWFRLCEESGIGAVCDNAAEYCCGDYQYSTDDGSFRYLNSPLCYCDFFNYAQNELKYTLKPKALNISTEFANP